MNDSILLLCRMCNEFHDFPAEPSSPDSPALARAEASGPKVGCQANAWPLQEGNFTQLLDVLREMGQMRLSRVRMQRSFRARALLMLAKAIEATGVRFLGAHTSLEPWQPATSGVAALE